MDDDGRADSLRNVRTRREELRTAMIGLEQAVTAPGGTDPAAWSRRAGAAADSLQVAFDKHVEATERPDGFLDSVVADAPRLAHACDQLRDEHIELAKQLAALGDAAQTASREAVLADAIEVLSALTRHRHRGADLVYEAYSVDIAASD
ncbi:MAG TPA: hypothetical protein VFA94_11065 [Acidimicrobiales bacterium]|nr:hypothetical protein [Acidimicrobiales bacterium]